MALKEDIIGRAVEMFMNYGIKAVSMDAVAQEVGISKRTLYENFSSKDELLSHCLDHLENKYRQDLSEIKKSEPDFISQLVAVYRHTYEGMVRVNPLFMHELSHYNYLHASAKYKETGEKNRNDLYNFLMEGRKEGYVLEDLDLNIIVDFFESQSKAPKALRQMNNASNEDVFRHVFMTMFRGICTRKGCDKLDELTATYNHKK